MATIKDIAKLAKVSQGTVSNVLNGRGNVSLERILLVQEAAEKLGYVGNAQAKQLRSDAPHSKTIALLLHSIDGDGCAAFFSGAKQRLETEGYQVLLFVTDGSPYREKQMVNQAAALRVAGAISVTCCLTDPELYRPLLSGGGKLVCALREREEQDASFVGFNLYQAGRDIGRNLCMQGLRRIGILTGPAFFSDSRELVRGLQDALNVCNIQPQVAHTDEVASLTTPFDFFVGGGGPEVLVLSSQQMLESVQLAASVGSFSPCPPIVTLAQTGLHPQLSGLTRYELDYAQAGHLAAQELLDRLTGKPAERIILPPSGFTAVPPPPHVRRPVTLRLELCRGQFTSALQRMAPSFTRETGICLDIDVKMPSQMYEATLATASDAHTDVIRSSMSALSLFPEDLFIPLEDKLFSELTEGMLPAVVQAFSRIGGTPRAVPFDIGYELLVYRKDLFEDALLKRMYYEKTGRGLAVPQTFDEFSEIVRFFDRRENSCSPVIAGTGLAIDSVVELFSAFLLRYLFYTDGPNFRRRQTSVDIEAVFRCVKNLQFCGLHALPVPDLNWIGVTLDPFIHGKTAMEMVYLNYASDITQLQKHTYGGQIGYAPLPGGRAYVTGGSFLLPATCRDVPAAIEFLRWACSPRQAELFTLLGGISPHAAIYESSRVLAQYPWYRELPAAISAAYGRDLWDTWNVNDMEQHCFPVLSRLVKQELSVNEAAVLLTQIMNSSLLS
ncbi:MAG: extracellular solute-binding protein [Oscillibacter sp.]|nr:extracellular solute-binding protein [Oscillibacter sp.]